jgi:hypothetical protein
MARRRKRYPKTKRKPVELAAQERKLRSRNRKLALERRSLTQENAKLREEVETLRKVNAQLMKNIEEDRREDKFQRSPKNYYAAAADHAVEPKKLPYQGGLAGLEKK